MTRRPAPRLDAVKIPSSPNRCRRTPSGSFCGPLPAHTRSQCGPNAVLSWTHREPLVDPVWTSVDPVVTRGRVACVPLSAHDGGRPFRAFPVCFAAFSAARRRRGNPARLTASSSLSAPCRAFLLSSPAPLPKRRSFAPPHGRFTVLPHSHRPAFNGGPFIQTKARRRNEELHHPLQSARHALTARSTRSRSSRPDHARPDGLIQTDAR